MATKQKTDDDAQYASIDQWAHKRHVDVTLADDITVKFRLPDIGYYLAQGTIPNPLRAIAERLEYESVNPAKLEDEDLRSYYDLQLHVIATHVVQPNILKACDGDVDKAKDWVLDNVPPMHRNHLWLAAGHIAIEEEALRSLQDLFRGGEEPPGSAAAGDGQGDAPEGE